MKLRYSPTSPYVRKVVVTAAETGLADRIELVPTNPRDPGAKLGDDNPLGKVPALVTDDGVSLFDSPVICEYLDSLHGGTKLMPASGGARWRELCRVALADGMLDAALLAMGEGRRPEAFQWDEWVAHQKGKIAAGLDALEGEVGGFGDTVSPSIIAVGCMLGYLDFRFADDDWRTSHPGLAAWYENFAKRPSMVATVPRDPA